VFLNGLMQAKIRNGMVEKVSFFDNLSRNPLKGNITYRCFHYRGEADLMSNKIQEFCRWGWLKGNKMPIFIYYI
jgi:hypothetical protein